MNTTDHEHCRVGPFCCGKVYCNCFCQDCRGVVLPRREPRFVPVPRRRWLKEIR